MSNCWRFNTDIGLNFKVIFIISRFYFKRFEFYTAPEELPRGTRAKTVCGNVGMIMFIMVTCMLTAVNLLM